MRIALLLSLLLVGCGTAQPEAALPTATQVVAEQAKPRSAADADVTFVRVEATAPDVYTFHVTVAHPDTGWEDYADGWDVVLPDGSVVFSAEKPFTRVLAHPHEAEQPFTRSQSGIEISAEITQVTVRAHDLVDGFGGQEVIVDLTTSEGEHYTVER